jgi:hypothetical protein
MTAIKNLIKNLIKEEMSHLQEMGRDDINLQAVLKKYDASDEVTKKTIAKIVLGSVDYKNFNPIASRVKIYKALRDMDYQDISYVTKMLGIR